MQANVMKNLELAYSQAMFEVRGFVEKLMAEIGIEDGTIWIEKMNEKMLEVSPSIVGKIGLLYDDLVERVGKEAACAFLQSGLALDAALVHDSECRKVNLATLLYELQTKQRLCGVSEITDGDIERILKMT